MQKDSFHPIIYVRGYAMTQGEIEDTVADRYMGFNLGSCKMRQLLYGKWKVEYRFASKPGDLRQADITEDDEILTFEIPVEQTVPPGIKARLRVVTRFWNRPA